MNLPGESISRKSRTMHVLTLTPFYPTDQDDASGCFVSEPLAWLARAGVRNTLFAVQPIYRGALRPRESAGVTEWLRYFSFPGGFGLPSAGAFLFARTIGRLR